MKWQVNVEVHYPEIGLVSAISCHATDSLALQRSPFFLTYTMLLCKDVSCLPVPLVKGQIPFVQSESWSHMNLQDRGVFKSDGDGTVPLISTGLMCYKGWRTQRLNPANISIVSREYVHQPSTAFKDLR